MLSKLTTSPRIRWVGMSDRVFWSWRAIRAYHFHTGTNCINSVFMKFCHKTRLFGWSLKIDIVKTIFDGPWSLSYVPARQYFLWLLEWIELSFCKRRDSDITVLDLQRKMSGYIKICRYCRLHTISWRNAKTMEFFLNEAAFSEFRESNKLLKHEFGINLKILFLTCALLVLW